MSEVNSPENPITVESFYKAVAEGHPKHDLLLQIINWINSVIIFDSFSDDCLPGDVDSMIFRSVKNSFRSENAPVRDMIFHLVEFVGREIDFIMLGMREKIYRSYESMPVYAVRETDCKCLQILARRPGRTVKEKLVNNPNLVAVRRRFSYDTMENQLFKIFLKRLASMIELRQQGLKAGKKYWEDETSALLAKMSYWLHSEAAMEIGQWRNNPPNNVLLQDRKYHKIWIGWNKLISLDDWMRRFDDNLPSNLAGYAFWNILELMNYRATVRIFQQPIPFSRDSAHFFSDHTVIAFDVPEFENFANYKRIGNLNLRKITLKKNGNKILLRIYQSKKNVIIIDFCFSTKNISVKGYNGDENSLPLSLENFIPFLYAILRDLSLLSKNCVQPAADNYGSSDKVAIDFTRASPVLFCNDKSWQIPYPLICQKWISHSQDNQSFVINCVRSRGIFLSHDDYKVSTYSLLSVIAGNSVSKVAKTEASSVLANLLHQAVNPDKLIYTVPDYLDDFALEPLRIGINSHFSNTKSIPVSIAVAEYAIQQKAINDLCPNDVILVVDLTQTGYSVTPIFCEYDEELMKEAPETQGLHMTRYPAEEFDSDIVTKTVEYLTRYGYSDKLAVILYNLFGLEGINKNLSGLSFYAEHHTELYEHLPSVRQALHLCSNITYNVNQFIDGIGKGLKYRKIHLIEAKEGLNLSFSDKKCSILKHYDYAAKGAYLVDSTEEKLQKSVLWVDHLPELAIEVMANGSRTMICLTKNSKVRPIPNCPVPIKIEQDFILPPGRKFYHFPIVKGEGKKKINLEAYISEMVFPLSKPLECKLSLTYTYGAADAYQLAFIPKQDIGLNVINVDWRKSSEIPFDYADLMIPQYPKVDANKHCSDSDNNKFFEWLEKDLLRLPKLRKIKITKVSEFSEVRTKIGTTIIFCNCTIGRDVSYPDKKFSSGDKCTFVLTGKKAKATKDYLLGKSEPAEEKLCIESTEKNCRLHLRATIEEEINFYPVHRIFKSGIRYEDLTGKISFQATVKNFISTVAEVFNGGYSQHLTDLYLRYCCYMTDNLPEVIIKHILSGDFWGANVFKVTKATAVLMRDCRKGWQIDFVNECFEKISNIHSCKRDQFIIFFATLVWQHEDFSPGSYVI